MAQKKWAQLAIVNNFYYRIENIECDKVVVISLDYSAVSRARERRIIGAGTLTDPFATFLWNQRKD